MGVDILRGISSSSTHYEKNRRYTVIKNLKCETSLETCDILPTTGTGVLDLYWFRNRCRSGSSAFRPLYSRCGFGSRKPDNCRSMIPIMATVAECRSGMFIPDHPGSKVFHPGSRIDDPGSKWSRIGIRNKKNQVYLTHKSVTKLLKMIRDFHAGSRIKIFSHFGSRIRGLKQHRLPDPAPQHWKFT